MLKKLLDQDLSKNKFREEIDELHTHDLAISLKELNEEERNKIYKYLTNEQMADIVSYLEPEEAVSLLSEFDLEKQKEIFDEMTLDDAVDILQAYEDEDLRDTIIESLDDSSDIKDFIKYNEDLVGAYMNNDYVVINQEMDVKEAVKSLIKQAPEAETINTLFVVDASNNYLGAVNLRKLVKARSPKLIKDIMIQVPIVKDETLISEAIHDMKNYEVFELPVINSNNELIGLLTLDDALDIALEEAEEGFQQFAALPNIDRDANAFKTALYRIPWLIVLLVLSIPLITFTDIMSSAVVVFSLLVFFQPLMLDSPGNVSTQTLAISLKAIANEGKMKKKDVLSEITSGLITGVILGLIAFVSSFLFAYLSKTSLIDGLSKLNSSLVYATILGGSLTIVVAISPLLAIAIPHLLKKVKVDPAVASGPFITTIIDLFSSLIYFGLAIIILEGVGAI